MIRKKMWVLRLLTVENHWFKGRSTAFATSLAPDSNVCLFCCSGKTADGSAESEATECSRKSLRQLGATLTLTLTGWCLGKKFLGSSLNSQREEEEHPSLVLKQAPADFSTEGDAATPNKNLTDNGRRPKTKPVQPDRSGTTSPVLLLLLLLQDWPTDQSSPGEGRRPRPPREDDKQARRAPPSPPPHPVLVLEFGSVPKGETWCDTVKLLLQTALSVFQHGMICEVNYSKVVQRWSSRPHALQDCP